MTTNQSRYTNVSRLALALPVAALLAAILSVGVALASRSAPRAHAAHSLSVSDEGHLHLAARPSGSTITEEGPVTGQLPGSVKVSFNVGATIYGSFTIYTRGGSISGHGSGALHSTGTYATFGGSLTVTSGTGRYRHAHGSGGLYGAINRHTYALTVQTRGRLSY